MIPTLLMIAALTVGASAVVSSKANDHLVARLEKYSAALPKCLSRFLDYPPGPGKLGFPRNLFEKPFVINSDFWLTGMDFSCVSPWNDAFGRFRAGTAISKRHVIFATHFPLSVGTRIAFVGVNGDVSHYSIKKTGDLKGRDISIGLLDYELTPDINPAKILPREGAKLFREGSRWPCVTFDQNEKAYLSELKNTNAVWAGGMYLYNDDSKLPIWKKYAGRLRSGDSGNPAFMIYNDQPILLYCVRGGGAGIGPAIHSFHDDIQRIMDDLCPGYKLEEFDFDSVVK